MPGTGGLSGGPVGDLICRGESNCDYNAYNRGRPGDSRRLSIDLSQFTVGELMQRQALPRHSSDRLFAVGKYQVVPATMRLANEHLRLRQDERFTPHLQERIFRDYLISTKRRAVKEFITGSHTNIERAQKGIALEWAAVAYPGLDGRGWYDNDSAGNKASITDAEIQSALRAAQRIYDDTVRQGKSPEQAYHAATGGSEADENEPASGDVARSGSANTSPEQVLSAFATDPRRFDPKEAVRRTHPIWDLVHEDLAEDKLAILGHTGSGYARDIIYAGVLQASDAVYRLAEIEGVEMKVALGGGSNGHSANHEGESIDIKPKAGWTNTAQAYRYAEVAAAAGANRLGIPHNSSGLHVQRVVSTGRPVMSWNYGADTNLEFRHRLQAGTFKSREYKDRVAALYGQIPIRQVQRALNAVGFSVREDDEMGRETADALKRYYGGMVANLDPGLEGEVGRDSLAANLSGRAGSLQVPDRSRPYGGAAPVVTGLLGFLAGVAVNTALRSRR